MMINLGANNFQCKVYSNRFIHTNNFELAPLSEKRMLIVTEYIIRASKLT